MTLLKTLVSTAYKQKDTVTRFLTGFFPSLPQYKFPGAKIQIDSVRGNEDYAVDVTPNAGGRGNKANIFTTKTYSPPAYDENTYITAEELNDRLPGSSVNDLPAYTMDFADLIMDKITILRNKIVRAIELQSRDGLVTGKIILINGDEIDFKQKASHQYSTPTAWTNSAADPFNDFEIVGDRVRKDASREIVDAVFGSAALSKFLNNANVKEQGDLKQIERIAMTSPIADDEGAKFHGQFSAGSYKINVWTYPQFVGVPLGFGLPNEGTKVPYIPTDKIIVLPSAPDFRLYFAGIPVLSSQVSAELQGFTGLTRVPAMEQADMIPYFRLDEKAKSILVGIESRPVAIPVAIDEAIIITVT